VKEICEPNSKGRLKTIVMYRFNLRCLVKFIVDCLFKTFKECRVHARKREMFGITVVVGGEPSSIFKFSKSRTEKIPSL
jgi:hypothetical protein